MAKKELSAIDERLSDNESTMSSLYELNKEIDNLNKNIGGQTSSPDLVQERLLDFISRNDYGVSIVSIQDVHVVLEQEFMIYTNQIELQGSYKDLINALYEIEKRFKESRVVSTQMYSKENFRTQEKTLFIKIILQNYENIK